MKVLTAELLPSNRRERKPGGVYIEFLSTDNVKKDDYFKAKVDGSIYSFQAHGIKVDGEELRITAKEVGYWCSKLDHKGIDLRTIINAEVEAVTDEKEKADIYERSCWC